MRDEQWVQKTTARNAAMRPKGETEIPKKCYGHELKSSVSLKRMLYTDQHQQCTVVGRPAKLK